MKYCASVCRPVPAAGLLLVLAVLLTVVVPVSADPVAGDLRLEGDNLSSQGLLKVFLNGLWGTVCDDSFDARDAVVACRQLGFSGASSAARAYGGPILMDDLACTGSESRLADCGYLYRSRGNCFWIEAIHLSCTESALPAVTIAAEGTAVAEGVDAAYTLSRSGDTSAGLSVQVKVSESGHAISGGSSRQVSFAPGAATASLSVATKDDLVAERDSRVTAAVSAQYAGSTFTYVPGSPASAVVTVVSDDPWDRDHVRSAARNLGTLAPADAAGSHSDAVTGVSDLVDYYVFTLDQPGRITLELRELEYDADLILEHADGDALYRSSTAGTAAETIDQLLAAGDWYVRVEARAAGVNEYVLGYDVTALTAEQMLSKHASLTGLTLSGVNIGTFSGANLQYRAAVAYDFARTTVAATAVAGATVQIQPADAAPAAGHQVTLASGADTAITVTVTAADAVTAQTYTVTVSRAAPPPVVSAFTLVDAAGGAPDPDLSTIADGAVLDLSTTTSTWFSIRADVRADAGVQSLGLELSGIRSASHGADSGPYTLRGTDGAGDYRGLNLPNGSYRITATPYTGRNLGGTALPARTHNFTVTGSFDPTLAPVTGFTLVDAAGGAPDGDLSSIAAGAALDLSSTVSNRFSIRAEVIASRWIGSVHLALSGPQTAQRTENNDGSVYTLYGEHGVGDYDGRPLPNGTYQVVATPYVERNGRGDALTPLRRSFTVTGGVQRSESPAAGDLRLEDGELISEGRLEVFLDGRWGAVCDDGFDVREAIVACRQLGFRGPTKSVRADGGPMWMDDLACTGSESRLADCSYTAHHDCFIFEALHLHCGAAELPEVTIAADATAVAKGALATFTLTRNGVIDAGLEVSVTVAEGRRRREGIRAVPSSVSFAANSATAVFSVRVDDDVLDDGKVIVAVHRQHHRLYGENTYSYVPDSPSTASVSSAGVGMNQNANVQEPAVVTALTAHYETIPETHDGSSAFAVQILFSEPISITAQEMRDAALEVSGATVTAASLVEGRDDLWNVTIAPDSGADVSVVLAAERPCTESGAICTAEGTMLATRLEATVAGPVGTPAAVPVAPELSLAVVPASIEEGEAATLTVAIGNGVIFAEDQEITVVLSGTAAADDYTLAAGGQVLAAPYALTLAAGAGTVTAGVSAMADREDEPAETIVIAAAHLGSPIGTRTVTVAANVTPLTARFDEVPEEHDGASVFTFLVRFDPEPRVSYRVLRDESFDVTGGEVRRARRVNGRNDLREIHVQPAGHGDVTVTLAGGRACGTTGAICTADARVLSNTLAETIPGPPGLSVADGRVQEAANATVDFAVTLGRGALGEVTVDYATAGGSATAGVDYRTQSGTLTFALGESERTVAVAVVDDARDEAEETFTLTLSNATGAYIADGQAIGTIVNSDPLPAAWLARFGRTVAEQVLEAVGERLGGSGHPQATVAGRRLSAGPAVVAGYDWSGSMAPPWLTGLQEQARALELGELVAGSSFDLLAVGAGDAEDAGAGWTVWGRGAWSRFAGSEPALSVEGEVVTGTLGADYERERLLAGLALSYSAGEGSFEHDSGDDGELHGTLLGVHPYVRLRLHERLAVWGLLGYALLGELRLEDTGADPLETDVGMVMGAFGARGTLLAAPAAGGLELSASSDGLVLRTRSAAVPGLAAGVAEVERLRLRLHASYRALPLGGGMLTPELEVGGRYDGGTAENGAGLVVGGSLGYTLPGWGLTLAGYGQGLLLHEQEGFREWGAGGSLLLDPDPPGQGLALQVAPAWGTASNGAAGLWSLPDVALLAAPGPIVASGSVDAELSYGLEAPGGAGHLAPYVGLEVAPGGTQSWRLGARLRLEPRVTLSLEGVRREPAGHDREPDHALTLDGTLRP